MGAAGCVGPAGVTLQLALGQSGARFFGGVAGAQPRPPPNAGPATPQRWHRLASQCWPRKRAAPPVELCAWTSRSSAGGVVRMDLAMLAPQARSSAGGVVRMDSQCWPRKRAAPPVELCAWTSQCWPRKRALSPVELCAWNFWATSRKSKSSTSLAAEGGLGTPPSSSISRSIGSDLPSAPARWLRRSIERERFDSTLLDGIRRGERCWRGSTSPTTKRRP